LRPAVPALRPLRREHNAALDPDVEPTVEIESLRELVDVVEPP